MLKLTINDEPIASSGALSVYYAAVDELERRYDGPDQGPHVEFDELAPPDGIFLVARVKGQLAGGVGLRQIVNPARRLGEVKRLWVRPDLRRAGVASALMADLEERARLQGYRELYLETGWAQPEAQAFYASHGWTAVECFPEGAFNHPDALLFSKHL